MLAHQMTKGFTLADMLADAEACNARLGSSGSYFGDDFRTKRRREKVAELMDQGFNGTNIAQLLNENQSTICGDVRFIKEERENNER